MKDFNTWNNLKKKLDEKKSVPFCNQREIWWCCLGLNVGTEQDGKNHLFERPVLVLKVFNKEMLRIAPLTSATKNDRHHQSIHYLDRTGSVILSQVKTISPKRFSRKLTRLDEKQFENILNRLRNEF